MKAEVKQGIINALIILAMLIILGSLVKCEFDKIIKEEIWQK